jgi:hypothetical protein
MEGKVRGKVLEVLLESRRDKKRRLGRKYGSNGYRQVPRLSDLFSPHPDSPAAQSLLCSELRGVFCRAPQYKTYLPSNKVFLRAGENGLPSC